MDKYTIAPPAGSTNNSVGAADRPWQEGHFNSVKLNGGDLGEYLAESTGYGIVSGCEPSISGLTVTVGAGVVHLADGTRKEIASTNITLDDADSTNPRIDLVYIDSTGTVAKITGTASASPSVPTLTTGGISVCNVSVAAGATTGTLTAKRDILSRFYNTGVVNVKDFGAVGDGVTDDTEAFRNALGAAQDKTLIVPQGTYLINENLFADNVNNVIDNGEYTYIKPVYPKKEAFIKELNMLKYAGSIPYTGADAAAEYQQGFCINRNTGKLLAAGVKGTSEKQTIYEVANDAIGTVTNSYSYSTLGHANTITHCPELGQFIVDDCTDENQTYNYSVINADTMVADPTQKSLPFHHFGISWDSVCKLFICAYQPTGHENITLYVCDINFNLLRTVSVDLSANIDLLNGGCCYDGVFFAPSATALSELSILGKEIKIHQLKAWELEDCDIYNGKLYMAVGSLYGQCDVYICDGVAIYNDSITVKTFDRKIPQNSTMLFPYLRNYVLPCEIFVSGLSDMPFSWTSGLLKVTRDSQGNLKQTLQKTASYETAVRYCMYGGSWSSWQKILGTFGGTNSPNGGGYTEYDYSGFGWKNGQTPTINKNGPWLQASGENGDMGFIIQIDRNVNDDAILRFGSKRFVDSNIIYMELANNAGNKGLFPRPDNTLTLGRGDIRWKQLFAATATISTSDERQKDNIEAIPDNVLDTWGEIGWYQYQFKDAIAEKGENARIHNGLIAQRIQQVFKMHGIDAARYGLFCYDEWEADEESRDENGTLVREARPAGNRYSLRYEECLAMEAAYQRRRADKLEERLKAIEEKLNLL